MESGERATSAIVRILLVGLMGSGKTSVGREAAKLLDWSFFDFDREVEKQAGHSITEIFRREGEEHFRALEADVGRKLLGAEHAVLATGGGWADREGRLDGLPSGTLSVWLEVSPAAAVRRSMTQKGARPLLDVHDPEGRAQALLDDRQAFYARAMLRLDSESAPPAVLARRIAKMVRTNG